MVSNMKRKLAYPILIFIFILAIYVVIFPPTLVRNESYSLVAPADLKEMTSYADLILIGKVREILPSKQDPEHGHVYTDVVIDVERYIKSRPEQSSIIIRTLGGKVGFVEEISFPRVEFRINERVLLFLRLHPESIFYRDKYFVFGADQGKVSLEGGTAYPNFGKGISGPMPEEELVSRISAHLPR